MASITKHTSSSIIFHLKHNTREYDSNRLPKNKEINPNLTHLNYTLRNYSIANQSSLVTEAQQAKNYYKQRMQELYHMNRSNLVCAAEWCCTLPAELKNAPLETQRSFFQTTYEFLNSKYGEINCIHCSVHYDEGIRDAHGNLIVGSPHLHYMFIPTVKVTDTNPSHKQSAYEYKVCAKGLIDQKHLSRFHNEYQKWIDQNGPSCTVHSGVTGGKSRTVESLKIETKELLKAHEKIRSLEKENQALKSKIKELEHTISLDRTHEKNSGWSQSSGWSSSSGWGDTKSWEKEY